MKVSIIIPFYGVEDYLRECLESVKYQTYEDIEVILVNDCSPDDCINIAREYLEDKRFTILEHSYNLGQGGARNTGLEVATGDCIFFLDSDDLIHKNTIEDLVLVMVDKKSDIVISPYVKFETSEEISALFNRIELKESSYNIDKYDVILKNAFSVWGILYKKSIVEGLSFENKLIGEDVPYLPLALERAYSIRMMDYEYIGYRYLRPGAITGKFKKHNRGMLEALSVLMRAQNDIELKYLKFIVHFVLKHILSYSVSYDDMVIFKEREFYDLKSNYIKLNLSRVIYRSKKNSDIINVVLQKIIDRFIIKEDILFVIAIKFKKFLNKS